jgi:hypothetical protein
MSAITTVLWSHRGVTCTSLVFDRHHIEIKLTVNGVLTDRVIFSNAETAARCAIEMLHDHFPLYL